MANNLVVKREARRRKILENSENRLNKICGRTYETTVGEEDATSSSFIGKGKIEKSSFPENLELNPIDSILEDTSAILLNSHLNHSSIPSQQQRLIPDQILNNESSVPCERPRPVCRNSISSRNEDDHDQSLIPPSQSPLISVFLLSDASYIFLALIVNMSFLLNLDHLFAKTIVVPYFAMTVARFLIQKSWKEPQESSMLMTALILCNINPKMIQNLRRIIGLSSEIFKGFALYLFSFVIIRIIFSRIWIDIKILIPSSSID